MGVAVGELSSGDRASARDDHRSLRRCAPRARPALDQEWSPVLLVVGLPIAHGRHRARAVRALPQLRAAARAGASASNADWSDERLTSHAAGQVPGRGGCRGRRQKGMLDQVAAQHILETFFTASHARCLTPRRLLAALGRADSARSRPEHRARGHLYRWGLDRRERLHTHSGSVHSASVPSTCRVLARRLTRRPGCARG